MTANGEPSSDTPLPRSIFVAVFLLSLAVLMVQIALNRLFWLGAASFVRTYGRIRARSV